MSIHYILVELVADSRNSVRCQRILESDGVFETNYAAILTNISSVNEMSQVYCMRFENRTFDSRTHNRLDGESFASRKTEGEESPGARSGIRPD